MENNRPTVPTTTDAGQGANAVSRVPTIPQVPSVTPAALPTVQAQLGVPPQAAPATGRKAPAKVVVELEVKEVTKDIADGASYTFWTFGGTVPRPDDPRTTWGHGGNAFAKPPDQQPAAQHRSSRRDRPRRRCGEYLRSARPSSPVLVSAINQGVYIYHCATAPVGMHIANGMYGLIVVEPEEGLPPVDKVYVAQGGVCTPPGPIASPVSRPSTCSGRSTNTLRTYTLTAVTEPSRARGHFKPTWAKPYVFSSATVGLTS